MLAFATAFAIMAYVIWIVWHNCFRYAEQAREIGNLLASSDGNIETDDEAAARILQLTQEEYKVERKRGNVLRQAGAVMIGIAEGLEAPIRIRPKKKRE